MFPYSSGPYPSFIHSSSSSSSSSIPYPPFPFLHQLENANSSTLNTSILQDPLSIPYIPTPIHESLTNLAVADQNHNTGVPRHDTPGITMSEKLFNTGHHYGISRFLTKKPPKKDRHSKIYTSQGLRDRRVRLSIEIARKFFDLQDTLGFDKASNTLEWLFSKSKKAIKDLAKSKISGGEATSFSSSSSSECDEEDCEVVSVNDKMPNNKERSIIKGKKVEKELCLRAKMKESREKARARARERTSNKIIMCNNNNNGRVQMQDMMKKKCPMQGNENRTHQMLHHHNQVEDRDHDFNVIEESIVIKRKLKPNSSMMNSSSSSSHQSLGLGIPREGSSNNENYHSFPNLSPNWDSNGATRSNFCAIASMNLSTGLQIFGKSWEECTNPRLH